MKYAESGWIMCLKWKFNVPIIHKIFKILVIEAENCWNEKALNLVQSECFYKKYFYLKDFL